MRLLCNHLSNSVMNKIITPETIAINYPTMEIAAVEKAVCIKGT